jgi:hypothetical protein
VPEYRVLLYEADTTANFGFGKLVHEFVNAKNLGYAHYLNDIGECFWTLNQDDLDTENLREHVGVGHVVIARDGEAVWRGIMTEIDASATDVILYGYGYEHVLYHIITPWNQTYENVVIGGISSAPINTLWNKAKTDTSSQLGFATTGSIQTPVTTSNGSTDLTLESYKLYYKRLIFAMKELVAIAVSDTTNVVYFELDYGTDPYQQNLTFNFWKDNGQDTDIRLEFPGPISNFKDRYVPIFSRNRLQAVGSGARDQVFRSEQAQTSGAFGETLFGTRQEPIYFNWVRDQAELDRVTKLRLQKSVREDISLFTRLKPNGGLLPYRASGSGYKLGDRIKVKIDRGITQVDKMMFLEGQQVIYVNGLEHVQPLFADRAGS